MEDFVNQLADVVENQPWLALPAAFLAGVISSASPCVLAMIPLLMGYVGGYAEGSQRKAITYSFVFVVGLTITFTVLGVIAGAFGRLFGDVGEFWKYVLPPVAILLGLQLLFGFSFGSGAMERFQPKRRALIGALFMGLFFGILSSPCATPVLAVILTLGAAQDNIAYSGVLLLFYALGHWILAFGAGVSTGFAQRVIESRGISNFSTYSKKIGGLVLIGVGVYLLAQAF